MKYGKIKKDNTVPIIFVAVVVIITLVFSIVDKSRDKDELKGFENCDVIVHYIDVGQGDSTFIQLPGGKSMLIDAGENNYGKQVVEYIKSQGEDYIDYVVATHPHSDHIGGMDDVINSMDIGTFYMPDCTTTTATYESMLDALSKKDIKVKQAQKGVVVCDNDGLKIEILSPVENEYDDLNDFSAVVRLEYKDKSFLFMGDAGTKVENQITGEVNADVLKAGHHGSSSSSGTEFLKRVNPCYAVISCGKGNDYGHPHKEIIKRFKKYKITTLRTDEIGTVVIGTDGEKIYTDGE